MKSKERVKGYKEGTSDWDAEYNMLLDDGVTCNECIHVERCCALFGQKPYINDGRCQFHPNRFKARPKEEREKCLGASTCGGCAKMDCPVYRSYLPD